MLELVQLADGKLRLVINYEDESIKIHEEWYFDKTEQSDAEEVKKIFTLT